jgi:transcriptional regulator with XRE-family HTH domain
MRAGLSQEECGRVVGLHRTELSLLERGGRTPRLDTLLALAAAIEAPPRELVTGMQWSPGVVEAGGEYVVEGIDA